MPREAAVTKAISAADSWTDSASFELGPFNLSIWGTFDATVTLQRSFDAGATWRDVETLTEASEQVVENAEKSTLWRIGVDAGNYTSGTINVRLGQ